MKKTILFAFLSFLCLPGLLCAKDYMAHDFGVRNDGTTLNTRIIQAAIDFISENGGGRLIFESGVYLTGTIYLKSDVDLHLKEGAELRSSENPFDFTKDEYLGWMSMIFAIKQQNIGITGKGTINGMGFETSNNMLTYIQRGFVTDAMILDRAREDNRPVNIYFRECENVKVTGVTLKDPANWNQIYDQCKDVYVDSITVDSKSYWNNDGIDIVDCDGFVLKNSYFDAADDVICFKSHDATKICQNVIVDNCVGRSSANGIKFGTVSRGGFRNIKITNVKIFDTYRSAITIQAVDGGIVENIEIDGVESYNTGNVIFLRTGDRLNNMGEKVSTFKDVVIKNVYAEVPFSKPDSGYLYEGPIEDLPRNISPAGIVGIPDSRIENVTLSNIEIVYPGAGNPHYASRGTSSEELESIPEMPYAYPEFSQFKELPAWGFYVRHADNLTFENITLRALSKDYRPSVVMDDVQGLAIQNIEISEDGEDGKEQIILNNVTRKD